MVKSKKDRAHLPQDCTDENALFESNILDYYRARPFALENSSLHSFASWYCRDSSNRVSPQSPRSMPRIRLLPPYEEIVFRKRTTSLIVRPCKIRQLSDDYYYSCLVLFLPHRTESDLLIPYVNYRFSFLAHFDVLDTAYRTISAFASEIDQALRQVHLLNVCLDDSNKEVHNDDLHSGSMNNYSSLLPPITNCTSSPIQTSSDALNFNNSDDQSWHSLNSCTISESTLESRIASFTND